MKNLQTPLTGLFFLFTILASCSKNLDRSFGDEAISSQATQTVSATATTGPVITTKFIKVNVFGGANACSNTEWNNWNTSSSLASSTFKYSDGTSSAVKASISGQNAVSDNGTSFTTTMAPKEVGRYASYSTSSRTLTISGLDNAKTYTLELYASRSGATNNTTRFTVGATSIDVLTDNNLDKKAVFSSLTPSNSQIVVNMAMLKTYNYLNGFTVIEETSNGGGSAIDSVVSGPTYANHILKFDSQNNVYNPTGSGLTWKPGDTVNIMAGTYGLIDLGTIKGEAGKPIIIRNKGGQVIVREIRFDRKMEHFKLLGNGHPGLTYGIKVQNAPNIGIAAAMVSDMEIAHVEIATAGVGIMVKKNPVANDPSTQYPNYTIKDIKIHHNYIHDISTEGMYIGNTMPQGSSAGIPIRLQNVEINNNTLERIGWDGIQMSTAVGTNSIHDNVVKDYGTVNYSSQQTGIAIGGAATGDIYNNTILRGTGWGINAMGYGRIRIMNNTLENCGANGIDKGAESIFADDRVSGPESFAKQEMVITGNIIKYPQPDGAIRVGAYHSNNLPSTITNNTVYLPNAPTDWLKFYVVSNAVGSVISENTVVR